MAILIRLAGLLGLAACLGCAGARPQPPVDRSVDRILARGTLGCGIEATVPGFSERDAAGGYRGFDIDLCRAVAAAVLGDAARVTFIPAHSVEGFRNDDRLDLVSRRITWELRREGAEHLLFGPVTFYDGQAFLVPASTHVGTGAGLAGGRVCVAGGTVFEANLNEFARRQSVAFDKDILESPHDYADIAARLADGRCAAYTGDVSDLGAIRAALPQPGAFVITADRLSKEPLAPLVRETDVRLFTIVRWTVFALVTAEELGVTSANVRTMASSADPDVRRLLGSVPGNGGALGLSEDWAARAIEQVGNYAEIYERNLGAGSAIGLERGANRLVRDGGLLFAPPLR